MTDNQDAAAREAEELLPCPRKHMEGYDFGFSAASCEVCSKRPAVAAALRAQRSAKDAASRGARREEAMTLRPEVKAFAERMERNLRANEQTLCVFLIVVWAAFCFYLFW